MSRRLPRLIAIALLLGAVSTQASAESPSTTKDLGGERLVDAIAKVRAKAAARDVNKDGWLSGSETSGGHSKLGVLYGPIERKIDANGDGRISVEEYVGAQVKALKSADTNSDGWITRSEARAQQRRLMMELLGGR